MSVEVDWVGLFTGLVLDEVYMVVDDRSGETVLVEKVWDGGLFWCEKYGAKRLGGICLILKVGQKTSMINRVYRE